MITLIIYGYGNELFDQLNTSGMHLSKLKGKKQKPNSQDQYTYILK